MDPVTKALTPSIRPHLKFENPGAVRVAYEVGEFGFALNGMYYPSATNFDNRSGIIHPRGAALFFHPALPYGAALIPGDTGTVSVRIRFWRSIERREILALTLRYTIAAVA